MVMSRKGQGLAFVSILVLIAILYFIFRFNSDTYGFVIQAGDEQAHLVTAYTEGANAKSFVQIAARDAAYEAIYNITNSKNSSALSHCTDASFMPKFENLFNQYVAMYASSTYLVKTSIPSYKFGTPVCSSSSLTIEGFGYAEGCKLQKNFPFPERPCEDETNYDNCTTGIKFTKGYFGNACTWDPKLNCTNSLPEPSCFVAIDPGACATVSSLYCGWEVSYSEKINVVSAPLINYQFSIDSDAHFIENINGEEYKAFASSRAAASKPSCIVAVEPQSPLKNTDFNITITYIDDSAPSAIDLKVSPGSIIANLTSGLIPADASDTTFSDGKGYYYAAKLVNDTYTADISCTDTDSNVVSAQKKFTVV